MGDITIKDRIIVTWHAQWIDVDKKSITRQADGSYVGYGTHKMDAFPGFDIKLGRVEIKYDPNGVYVSDRDIEPPQTPPKKTFLNPLIDMIRSYLR